MAVRKLLTPEELEEIRISRSFKRAMAALETFVVKPSGRPAIEGGRMSATDYQRRWREKVRQAKQAGE